jgi:hypothetical protein
MTTMNALNNVAAALRQALASMMLDKAESQPGDEKVTPVISVGYAPPRNSDMSGYGQGYHAPCVIVGMGESGGTDDGKEASMPVMITFGTYSPGGLVGDGLMELNNEGYIDLINLIDRAKNALSACPVLEHTTVEKPLSWGMYPDQPYPYWYGWLSFDAKVLPGEALPAEALDFLSEINIELG